MDWSPLAISLKTSLAATALAFLPGVLAARLVTRRSGRLRAILDGVFTFPMVLPPTVLGFLLLMLLGKHGPLGSLFARAGIRLIFTWVAAAIAGSVIAFPLIYRTVRGALEQIDPAVVDAARTLGLAERTVFWRVLMPIALPGTAGGLVLAYARVLGEFGATLMVAGNIPGKTQTIPVAIYFAVEGDNAPLAFVWVGVIASISVVAMFLLNALGGEKHGYPR